MVTCALIIALFLSCFAFSTMNLASFASCAATCLASMASVNYKATNKPIFVEATTDTKLQVSIKRKTVILTMTIASS